MEILILEKSKIIRDQILVGLQTFPELAVETGVGFGGLNRTRQKTFDCMFVGCNLADKNGLELVDTFRKTDSETDVILVTASKKTKSHQALRARYDLFSILYVPIEPKEFFRLVARLRRRETVGS